MPRQSRQIIYKESDTFHVLVQGIAKSYIFDLDKDKSVYLNYLNESVKKHDVSLLAYCVMGNHAHLLVSTEDKESISKCFYQVNRSYAQYYNAQRRRVGYVFRNRFRIEAIIGEDYLVNCISYIHNNPVKSGMVKRATTYKFSSCKSYETRKGIVDFEKLDELVGATKPTQECDYKFFEDEYEGAMELEQAIDEVMQELKIKGKKDLADREKLKKFVESLQSKTKVSLREIANILEINREVVRKAMSSIT